MSAAAPVIEVHELCRSFAGMEAVRGISLQVARGEIFGFLGPNGAGKTTSIKMLCTLLKPTRGWAKLSGFDVVQQPDDVRKNIGVIFQEPSLDTRLTARENLELHAVAYHVARSERAARIDEALEFVELESRASHMVHTFSGGMRRRLEIARGLIHRPRVLFLDEPTTGLDPQTRLRTWEVLRTLRDRYAITIFMTTHYMDEAENCDRIAIIDHGRIVAQGSPSALKQQVGHDRVFLRTADREGVRKVLQTEYALSAESVADGLTIAVPDGERFVVQLLGQHRLPLEGIGVQKPTLDDVFLSLTGRQMRDVAEADADQDRRRARAQRRGI